MSHRTHFSGTLREVLGNIICSFTEQDASSHSRLLCDRKMARFSSVIGACRSHNGGFSVRAAPTCSASSTLQSYPSAERRLWNGQRRVLGQPLELFLLIVFTLVVNFTRLLRPCLSSRLTPPQRDLWNQRLIVDSVMQSSPQTMLEFRAVSSAGRLNS